MVCRTAQIGSASTSFVIQTTSLAEQQVLSLYHEVMREGRSAAAPTESQQRLLTRDLSRLVNDSPDLSPARRDSIMARLARSASEPMDGRRYYATNRLVERAQRAEEALTRYVADAARDLGVTESAIQSRMNIMRDEAGSDRTLRPSTGWVAAARNSDDLAGLPLDRQTAYAIESLNTERTEARAARPARPTVAVRESVDSSAVQEMGYDPETGRVEVVLNSSPEIVYAYRMTPHQYQMFRNAASVGAYYATEVRGNDEFRYADAASATAASEQTQCATCGQFEGTAHACPPRDSVQERNRTERRARTVARTQRRRATQATPLTHADEEDQRADTEALRLGGSVRNYRGESGSFTTTNITDTRAAARLNSQGVQVSVNAFISRVSGPDGISRHAGHALVAGTAVVTYNGRGRGYTATAVAQPGDTGRDQLRCDCSDYRANYDCVHVRQAVQDLNTRLNQTSLRERHLLGPAIAEVNAALAADLDQSVTAQTFSRESWVHTPTYGDDHAAFQADYKAARDRQAAGDAAVPYMTENATGGLGARDGGRGFGVELEFDFGPGVASGSATEAIARDLYAAGLSRHQHRRGYQAQRADGYTEAHNGWSFEYDSTVGGELVSPIMHDDPQHWENLAKACEIIKRHGGVVTQRTGSHVHVSTGNYNHTVANHNRLLGAFAENEDVLYRLSSNPERGTHRGPSWCAPNRVPTSGYRDISHARSGNNSHNIGLNMQSVAGRNSDHVEFRTWDASLDPAIIQTQIKVSLGVTEAAFRDNTYQPGAHTPMGSHRAHNRSEHGATRRLTGDAWRQDVAGYKSFADRIFARDEDKAQMTALFSVTKWQRAMR